MSLQAYLQCLEKEKAASPEEMRPSLDDEYSLLVSDDESLHRKRSNNFPRDKSGFQVQAFTPCTDYDEDDDYSLLVSDDEIKNSSFDKSFDINIDFLDTSALSMNDSISSLDDEQVLFRDDHSTGSRISEVRLSLGNKFDMMIDNVHCLKATQISDFNTSCVILNKKKRVTFQDSFESPNKKSKYKMHQEGDIMSEVRAKVNHIRAYLGVEEPETPPYRKASVDTDDPSLEVMERLNRINSFLNSQDHDSVNLFFHEEEEQQRSPSPNNASINLQKILQSPYICTTRGVKRSNGHSS
eukprot:scaffold12283_cov47-Attheya_sp.AAC.5